MTRIRRDDRRRRDELSLGLRLAKQIKIDIVGEAFERGKDGGMRIAI